MSGLPAWAVWSLVGSVLAIGELLTPGLFFLGPVALAALVAAVAATVVGGAASLVVFICACVVALGVLRPLARRSLKVPPPSRTGALALVGTSAVVLQHVDRTGGRVKIGGEEWSARAFLDDQAMEPGEHVEVVKIDGATALVL
jgi:membrane protein implicated in regulation of membrane protease activity